MKRSTILSMAVLLIGFSSIAAKAAPVSDQANTDYNASYVAYSQIGQSFVAGLSGKLTSLDLFSSSPVKAAGNATVSIYAGESLLGPALASGTLAALIGSDRFSYDLSLLDFDVIAGMQYSFNIDTGAGNLSGNADTQNGYGGGKAYFNGSQISPDYDLNFATYVRPSGSAVPEPASWVLMFLGFGLIGGMLRLRGDFVASIC